MSGKAPITGEELRRLGAALLNDGPDAIIYSDRDGIIRFWNAGATRIFGYDGGEALGRSLDIIIPERLRERHWQGYARMMETGRSRYPAEQLLSVPAQHRSGKALSIQFTVVAIKDTHGRIEGIAAVLRDVTATFEQIKRLKAAAKP
ncbi:MAG: PAS domain-containing protein [Hyphomicrobiaceae bacterium]